MKILVTSYYDEFALPVTQRFCAAVGAHVTDWFIAYPSQNPQVTPQACLPGAVVHDINQAGRGIPPYPVEPKDWPAIDQAIFERMLPYEHVFYDLLCFYDPTGNEFTHRERQDTYRALMQLGLHVIGVRRPDLYISFTAPHSLHAYILYALCRAHRIPTLVLMSFAPPGYVFLQPTLEHTNPALDTEYAAQLVRHAGGAVDLPTRLQPYYDKVRSNYSEGVPWYSLLRNESLFKLPARSSEWLRNPLHPRHPARPALRWVKGRLRFGISMLKAPRRTWRDWAVTPMGDYFKRQGVPLEESRTTLRDYSRLKVQFARQLRKLLAAYRELQRAPDLDQPFVFVPLHYQPEVSTTPLGGYFADQIAMVDLLAKSLPAGWHLYVKEHKAIFDPEVRGTFMRDIDYYRRLARIPNVTLVPMELTSFDLIDRARAVATVTGTAGWEAVLRGKPAIVYGNAWYRGCEGVFDGHNGPDTHSALAKIAAGFVPDPHKVRVFLCALAEVGVYADRDNTFILTDLTMQQSEDALVAHFLREYRRFYPA
jgi:hypothetical protein